MTKSPEPVSAQTFAAQLSAKVLHCRELGHEWRNWAVSYDESSRSYDRELLCTNCRTVRRQIIDSRGFVVSNSYRYPTGYLASNVETGVSRDIFRMEAITRAITHADNADAAAKRGVVIPFRKGA